MDIKDLFAVAGFVAGAACLVQIGLSYRAKVCALEDGSLRPHLSKETIALRVETGQLRADAERTLAALKGAARPASRP